MEYDIVVTPAGVPSNRTDCEHYIQICKIQLASGKNPAIFRSAEIDTAACTSTSGVPRLITRFHFFDSKLPKT